MRLQQPGAELFIPDGTPEPEALARVTHLSLGAHPDDLETMAPGAILACVARPDQWFGGVVLTDGAGSARSGPYADYTDAEMRQVRRQEQWKAATVGGYAFCAMLDYPSSAVKSPPALSVVADLRAILEATRPRVVYTHNPADKHDTHVGVCLRTLAALRELPPEQRPERVYGCESWRDLDWLLDEDKCLFPLEAHPNLMNALIAVFDSQIVGGKRYDLALPGRWRAHATMLESHAVDVAEYLTFALDLTPLLADPTLDVMAYTEGYLQRFVGDVRDRLRRLS